MNQPAPPRPERQRRWLAWLSGSVKSLALLIVFLVALTAGAVLHLGLPVSRSATGDLLERLLSRTLQGTIEIGEIERLAGGGIGARDVRVFDPEGRLVLSAERLRADVDPVDIIRRVLSNYEKLSIHITQVEVRGADLDLISSDPGEVPEDQPRLSLARAFLPVDDDQESSSTERDGRPIRLWFSDIRLVEVNARGSVAGSPNFQASVDEARAKLLVTNRGVLLDLDRFGVRASGLLGVDTRAQGEFHLRVPGAIFGKVAGFVGEVPLEASFHYERDELEAELKAPRLSPDEVRPLVSGWPLTAPVTMHATAKGRLPQLTIDAEASLLDHMSRTEPLVKATAQLDTTFNEPITGEVLTSRLNLAKLMQELPSSSIDSETRFSVDPQGEFPRIELNSRIAEFELQGQNFPSVELEGHYDQHGFRVDARIDPQVLPARLYAERKADEPISFSATVAETRIEHNRFSRPYVAGTSGSVEAEVRGTYAPEEDHLHLDATLSASGLQNGTVTVRGAELKFKAMGSATNPLAWSSDATLVLSGVDTGKMALDHVQLKQSGPIGHPQLQLDAQGDLGAKLSLSTEADVPSNALVQLDASIEGQGKTVLISAKQVAYRNDRFILDGFHLESLGTIDADVDFHPTQGGTIVAQARNLSLSRISERAGMPRGDLGGNLDADIDLQLGEQSQGKVHLVVNEGALLGFTGLEVSADATVDGRSIDGSTRAEVRGLGALAATWNAELAGSPLREASYRAATGHLSARLAELDLATLTLLLGLQSKADLDGTASLQLDADREVGEAPSLSLSVKTTNFRALIPDDEGQEPLVVRGVDLDGVVSLIPEEASLSTALRFNDRLGLLSSFSGEIELPLQQWLDAPPTNEQVQQAIVDGPLDLVVLIPERSVSQWPTFIPSVVDSGYTSARIAVTGTLRSPELAVVFKADGLSSVHSMLSRPLDLDANVRYVAATGRMSGNLIVADDTQSLASLGLNLVLPWRHLVGSVPPDTPAWTGQIRTQLEGVPLSLPLVTKELGLDGRVEGTLLIERSVLLPALVSELRVRGLSTKSVVIGDADLEVGSSGDALVAHGHLSDDYGELDAIARLKVEGTPWALRLKEGQGIRIDTKADKYNLAAVSPFLQDTFQDLSGLLSGQLEIDLRPPQRDAKGVTEGEWQTSLDGQMRLSSGHIQPSAIGLNLEDVSMTIDASAAPPINTIQLEQITAKVRSEAINVRGQGVLRLRNLSPESGEFELKADQVPIYSGANELLTATGRARGKLSLDDELMLSVQVQELLVELAEAVDDSLIELDENPNIEVIQRPKKAESDEGEVTPINVSVDLGDDARVKNQLLDARITGSPQIRIAEETTVGGSVEVKNGSRFVVLGRTFVVDRGLVLFDTGDAADPHLQVGATWKAPNNVLVRLDVGGTVSRPTLTWSSEPTLPGGEADVLSLVIGGGGGGGGEASTSLAIAANELNKVEGLEFYATQTSSQGASQGRLSSLNETTWENYTAAYQISEKLWFEGSVATSNSSALQSEQLNRTGVSGTLDWRFLPNWSLRTEVGTLGLGLDLLWQYRY